ncbi:hypothetical protein C8R43DRAFT_1134343 [Mycena crocata]|nr:hypothetical protein C8R43DRAFT_1134343 [Mycena crocata]
MSKNRKSGYESDTGERDNPTCWHFKTNTPVERVIQVQLGYHTRLMNRKGRAICRIVHAHGWSTSRIAVIFGISANPIARALENSYQPSDNLAQDYDKAGPDFKVQFPPLKPQIPPVNAVDAVIEILDTDDEEDTKNGIILNATTDAEQHSNGGPAVERPARYAKSQFLARMKRSNESQEHEVAEPSSSSSPDCPAVKELRTPESVNLSLRSSTGTIYQQSTKLVGQKRPRQPSSAGTSSNVEVDCTSGSPAKRGKIGGVSDYPDGAASVYRHYHPTHGVQLIPLGLPVPSTTTVSAPARFPLPQRGGRNIASYTSAPAAPVAVKSASAHAAAVTGKTASALPANPVLDQLDIFLANALGVENLAAHRALFLAQGFDMRMMRILSRCGDTMLHFTLRKLLQDGASELNGQQGLSRLEVVVLENAIRGLADST